MSTLTLSAPRRRAQVVTPTHQAISPRSLTRAAKRIGRAIFSTKMMAIVAIAVTGVALWHVITIDDTIASQRAIGIDCLIAMPWAIAWVLRTSFSKSSTKSFCYAKKGGEQ